MLLNGRPIEGICLVPSENVTGEAGETLHCVYDRETDAVTFVGAEEAALLLQHGVQTLDALPEEPPVDVAALCRAVREADEAALQALIHRGADVRVGNERGWTPLHEAAFYGRVDMVRLLLDAGAPAGARATATELFGSTPLHAAAHKGHAAVVHLLLAHGADVAAGDGGRTPLRTAAMWGHADAARLLLEHGAAPSVRDADGSTPLHYAAFGGHADVVHLLLAHGADVNARTARGETPLASARRKGRDAVARLLEQEGGR